MTRSLLLVAFFGLALLAAPGNDSVARGKAIFHDTQDLEYPSCAQCHSLLPQKEELAKAKYLGPGSTLYGSAIRAGWRNMNTFKDVGEASQLCAKKWQARKKGLKAAQRADIVAFLKTHAPKSGSLPKRKVPRRPKLTKAIDGGDAAQGKRITLRYCAGCHNKSDDALSFAFRANKRKKSAVARAIRGYDNKLKFKPKTMSYYSTERLTDEQLRHLVAYLGR